MSAVEENEDVTLIQSSLHNMILRDYLLLLLLLFGEGGEEVKGG